MTAEQLPMTLDAAFKLTIVADRNSGWACVQIPGSAELCGTGKSVGVAATVNGHPYEASMLPIGGGVHMLPLRAPFRRQLKLELGDEIDLVLLSRVR